MTTPSDTTAPQGNPARKKALTAVSAVVLAAGLGYAAYWALVLNHYETTDNAYVQGNVVQITPQVAGTVVAISANDNDHVQAGQWLVRLDPTDAKIALEQAEAQLAQTVREVRTLYANNRTQGAQIALREADLARAQADLQRLQDDVARRQPLVASGAVGQEEFKHATAQLAAARSATEAARAAVLAAKEQLASNQTLTEGIAVDQHPSVLRASARVREAYVALKRVELQAPVAGYVARRNVQLGQRVPAGSPLLSVIALDQVWVDANFKESQLKNLRLGQPVELSADVYGKNVTYRGTIEGLGAGTGAAFALLPAQNATGNWIKVVQRVPVRVRLDAKELVDHPLRLGLSMEARVDVSKTDGRMLADAAAAPQEVQTAVFEQDNREADTRVQQIIGQHGGGGSRTAAATRAPAAPAAPALPAAPVSTGSVALAR